MKHYVWFVWMLVGILSCNSEKKGDAASIQADAASFLIDYNTQYQALYYTTSLAEWALQTQMIEGDSTKELESQKARKAMAAFTGSKENIDQAKRFLEKQEMLTSVQVKQLKKVLYNAADNPQTIKEVVENRIKAETAQTKNLYSYRFMMEGKEITPNELDGILAGEKNEAKRLAAWNASKEVGKGLKDGLENLRNLRNETVNGLGYPDFFTYQVSDYGMTRQEMLDLLRKVNDQLWPVFRELHTFTRYELAKKYGAKEVPDLLPAHWMPNRWGQDWASLVDVKGINLDDILKNQTPEWIVKQGERFYISLGFDSLPASFWEKSDLYPLPKDAKHKKNTHASAWHLDLGSDIRSLMSVEPNERWYETSHHELGHIYYYNCYTHPEIPPLLREGANRAYHEAFGSLMGFAAMHKPFLAGLNLIPQDTPTNDTLSLLKEALNYVVFMPWSAGVMSEFENDLYAEKLPKNEFNKRWWELAAKYQGMKPPADRGEEYCDAATKTHINDDAAQYYDYALSYVILFQVHDYISKQILKQDPHATNYYGNKEIGGFLKSIMQLGASRDWREVLKEKTGEELSARAMVDYFSPLMNYLKRINAGRKYTLPEKPPVKKEDITFLCPSHSSLHLGRG